MGAVVLTTLGISAADTLSGNANALLGQLGGVVEEKTCPSGMVEVLTAESFRCVDIYEASPAEDCPIASPSSVRETQENLNDPNCASRSVQGVSPWTYITREQAAVACARAGKRLPNAEEWYRVAIGTPDALGGVCNTESDVVTPTGSRDACVSAVGVYDAVGNVWEWVIDDILNGKYNNRALPESGYVSQVDSAGVATVSSQKPSAVMGDDYFWQDAQGAYAMLRGGFFRSKEDAGVYAVHAKTAPTQATVAIGFRCVR